jgi:hypothetical protein
MFYAHIMIIQNCNAPSPKFKERSSICNVKQLLKTNEYF